MIFEDSDDIVFTPISRIIIVFMAPSSVSRGGKGEAVGGKWLCREYGIDLVQPLRYTSIIGGDNVRREANGRHDNTFLPSYAPPNTLIGHLEFTLKHERVNLELFSRLFTQT